MALHLCVFAEMLRLMGGLAEFVWVYGLINDLANSQKQLYINYSQTVLSPVLQW